MKSGDYVERRDGGFWIAGSRVSLDSIVISFLDGESAEAIAASFPVLELEQIYGAIAFYLGHRAEIDSYLEASSRDYEAARQAERAADPAFFERLRALRQQASVG